MAPDMLYLVMNDRVKAMAEWWHLNESSEYYVPNLELQPELGFSMEAALFAGLQRILPPEFVVEWKNYTKNGIEGEEKLKLMNAQATKPVVKHVQQHVVEAELEAALEVVVVQKTGYELKNFEALQKLGLLELWAISQTAYCFVLEGVAQKEVDLPVSDLSGCLEKESVKFDPKLA